jgi:hypothetical protein
MSRHRESIRIHRRQNQTASDSKEEKVDESCSVPLVDYNDLSLEQALRKVRIGHAFEAVECSYLPGLGTSSHIELSVFMTKERHRVKEATREGALWTHQVSHDHMGSGVTYQLWIRPFVGPHADNVLVYLLECDADNVADFVVKGVEEEEVVMIVPQIVQSLSRFLSICLQMTFTVNQTRNHHNIAAEDEEENEPRADEDNFNESISSASSTECDDIFPPSLLFFSQRSVICHLDIAKEASTHSIPLPLHIKSDVFGKDRLLTINVSLWPSTAFVPSTSIVIQEGMLACEFIHILKRKVGIPEEQTAVLYHKFQMLQGYDELNSDLSSIDCFIPLAQEENPSIFSIVLSLIGSKMADITLSPSTTMKEFDIQVRRLLGLAEDSFLVFLPDGHYTPPYTTSSGWKCVHPFTITAQPRGSSFSRSFRQRRSFTQRRQVVEDNRFERANPARRSLYAPRDGQSQRRGMQNSTRGSEVLQQAENTSLNMLSSPGRHFPSKTRGENEFGIPMYRVYHEMSMYQLTLEQYGLSQQSIVQVYEVTGPAVPVANRPQGHLSLHQSQRGNLMDVNPNWSLFTFAHYFDAMMSPSAIYLDKDLTCGDLSVRVSNSPEVTLKSLFENWKPVWWGEGKELTRKDLLLSHFLSVQNV